MNGLVLRAIKGTAIDILERDESHALRLVQAGHGLAVGDLVYPDSDTTWAKAIGTAGATVAAGVVVARESADVAHIACQPGTAIPWPAHGLGSAGTSRYLSQATAGASQAEPAAGIVQPCLYVVSPSLVLWVGLPTLYTEI